MGISYYTFGTGPRPFRITTSSRRMLTSFQLELVVQHLNPLILGFSTLFSHPLSVGLMFPRPSKRRRHNLINTDINFFNLRTRKLRLQVFCQRQIRDNDAFRILVVRVTNRCPHY